MKAIFLAVSALLGPVGLARADDEIVITGDRRAVELSKVAGNAAALDAAQLQSIGAQHPAEGLNQLPGVSFHRGSGVETLPAIRSPVLTGGDGAGSILILEDGVPIRAPGFANINEEFETSLDFADRVEVTRGPGSALYGSNAVHGLVNVITPNARSRAVKGEHGETRIEAAQFGRVEGDYLGFRPSGAHGAWLLGLSAQHETGWRDDAGVDQQRIMLGRDGALAGWDGQARLVLMNMNQETAGFVQGTDSYKNTALSRQNANPEAFRDEQLARGQIALSHSLGARGQVKIIPFARWIDTALLQHFLPSKALEETSQSGGGVEASYYFDASPKLSWIFGADLDRSHGTEREVQSIATQPGGYVQGLHYDYTVDALALAAYAQARWTFAPRWTATLGARGENVRYEYDNHAPTNDVGRFRRPADRDDTFDAITPKLGIAYALNGAGAAYLNLARGARPPQTVDLYSLQVQQNPGDQKAETIDSIELGARKSVGKGRIEIDLYHMMKRHAAFRNANGFTVPDARTMHDGIEVSGRYPLTTRLSASGWLTYAQHTYRFTNPSTLDGESINFGADVDTAPRWIWNGALTWTPLTRARAELGWTHMGRYFTNAANTHIYLGHDVFDLRLQYQASAHATFFTAIRNLTNTDYAERADFAFGADRYFPGEDRAVSLGVRSKF